VTNSGDERAAGSFAAWLAEFDAALHTDGDARVPCDGCTACCESRQFVHIAPNEKDTLDHIPVELHVPAPGMPGHVVLGYDQHGRCPMLADGGCSIYEHRPRTCRAFDCRVFAAAGVEVDADKPLLAGRVRSWWFDHPTPADRHLQEAAREAARQIAAEKPGRPAEIALRAVQVVVRHSFSDRESA
jgi:Fe-S-cluster containining protein